MSVYVSVSLTMADPVILEHVGLGYVVLLLMPVLARMSNQEDSVRMMASRCFTMLVNLVPLEVSASCCELLL